MEGTVTVRAQDAAYDPQPGSRSVHPHAYGVR